MSQIERLKKILQVFDTYVDNWLENGKEGKWVAMLESDPHNPFFANSEEEVRELVKDSMDTVVLIRQILKV